MQTVQLSKSEFNEALRCPKLLWLRKNHPELAASADEKTRYLFAQGQRVGALARTMFPGGALIGDGAPGPFARLAAETDAAIHESAPFLFEAAFSSADKRCKTDLMERNIDTGDWDLGEVKMACSVKPEHVPDIAFQVACVEQCHCRVRHAHLVHINSKYNRTGEINVEQLFVAENITEEARAETITVEQNLAGFKAMLRESTPPVRRVGGHCDSPGECLFYAYCHSSIPEHSIYELPYGARAISALEARGIMLLRDIPDGFPLSPRQQALVSSAKRQCAVINIAEIRSFLNTLQYPIVHIDFETGMWPIPPWDNVCPYEPIPFQFSADIQHSIGGPFDHHEFVIADSTDPRPALIEQLLSVANSRGSLCAWNASYEQRIIKKLAERFPNYREQLLGLLPRFRDPISVFRGGFYADFRIGGSAGLKHVLPVLVPCMSYDELEIRNGDQAALIYQRFIDGELTAVEWERNAANLRLYCGRDTEGVVRIIDSLYRVASA